MVSLDAEVFLFEFAVGPTEGCCFGCLWCLRPHLPSASTDCPPIRDYVTLNVTSSSFWVSWRLNSSLHRTFHVQVYKGEELLQSASTAGRTLEVAGLEAGELYGVKTSYQACGGNVTATLTVRTGKGTHTRPASYLRVCGSTSVGPEIPILFRHLLRAGAVLPGGAVGAPCPLSGATVAVCGLHGSSHAATSRPVPRGVRGPMLTPEVMR